MKIIRAACHYFLLIFALGFVLGTIRTLLILPTTGPLIAVLFELPIMVAASWYAATFTVSKYAIAPVAASRLAMGATALGLLMMAEVALGFGFGRSLSGQVDELLTSHGLLGLAGQILFGLIPWIMLKRRS